MSFKFNDRWTYAASKGAINMLTKSMALDMAKERIRVNSISPGETFANYYFCSKKLDHFRVFKNGLALWK